MTVNKFCWFGYGQSSKDAISGPKTALDFVYVKFNTEEEQQQFLEAYIILTKLLLDSFPNKKITSVYHEGKYSEAIYKEYSPHD